MKIGYRIFLEDPITKSRRYFSTNNSILDAEENVEKQDAKLFFKKEHAEANIITFEKTARANKAKTNSGFDSKWDEFLSWNPFFSGLQIEEVEFEDIYFTIKVGNCYYSKFDIEGELITIGKENLAFHFNNYEDVKIMAKRIINYIPKSNIEIKHHFINERN